MSMMKKIVIQLMLIGLHIVIGELMSHVYLSWMYGETDREAVDGFMFALPSIILLYVLPGFVVFWVGGYFIRLTKASAFLQMISPYLLWVAGMTIFRFQLNPTTALVSNVSACLILSLTVFLVFRRSKQVNEV